MQHYAKKLLLVTLPLLIAGCSSIYGDRGIIQNRATDYLKADSIAPLRIPPGMSSSTIHEVYPVSDRAYPNSKKEIDLIPPELNSTGN